MAKNNEVNKLGRVVLFKDWSSQSEGEVKPGGNDVFELLPIHEIHNDSIYCGKYVLPISDATILNSQEGLVYAYNVSLPYLKEISHLAEVEKNIVIGQAYLYQGRNVPTGKPSLFQWALVIFIFLLAIVAIMKG